MLDSGAPTKVLIREEVVNYIQTSIFLEIFGLFLKLQTKACPLWEFDHIQYLHKPTEDGPIPHVTTAWQRLRAVRIPHGRADGGLDRND